MRRNYFLAATFVLLSVQCLVAQTSVCPAADPVNRPSNITPSAWNLTKLINQMQYPQAGLILVTSHRGNWEYCPENTLESFQSAWDLGAEGAEMDVRLSAPGSDGGVNYSSGEVFLSHDFDIRGEAPNSVSGTTNNLIYTLTPAELRARQMSDRRGNLLNDSNGNPVRMHSFTDLLNSYYDRARRVGFTPGSGGSPITDSNGHWDLMNTGLLLTIDVKSAFREVKVGSTTEWKGATQYDTFMECIREMIAFQNAKRVDLRNAIAFKLGFNEFIFGTETPSHAGAASASALKAALSGLGLKPNQSYPKLIFILFPEDAVTCTPATKYKCSCPLDGSKNCQQLLPANFTALNDIDDNYTDSTNGTFTKQLLVNDWQYRNPNNALAIYFTDPRWSSRGAAMFLASNNYSEGVRNSAGDCLNTFKLYRDTINTSYCTSDPLQRWASSSLDYLLPASGQRATSITTDQYQNAIRYLNAMGLNNTSIISGP